MKFIKPHNNILSFLLMTAITVLLLACGAAPETPTEDTAATTADETEVEVVEEAAVSTAEETEAEAAEAMAELVITHPQGETTVGKNPERVVVFNYSALDTLDQLGIPVVGVPQGPLMPPHLAKYNGEEYANVGSFHEADMEKVNELQPDLIIVGLRSSPLYEDLSELAPTIDVTVDWENKLESFKDYVTNLGIIFDKEAEVAERLATIDEHIAEVQALATGSNYQGLIVLTSGGEVSGYGPGSRFGLIHDMLGVAPTTETMVSETHGDTISFEFILDQNPDVIYVLDRDAAIGEQGEAAAQTLDNELVNSTTAGSTGNIVYLDPVNWYLVDAGLSTLDAMISDVAAGLGEMPVAPTEGATEREIQHELGSTTITGVPERIVVLEYSFADNLGTLGVAPVGYAVDAPPEYVLSLTEEVGAEAVGTRKEPNLEAITALNPDFIIADLRRHEPIYEQLSAIAPTVVFNSLRGSYQDQLDTFITIAQALDKENEAIALLDEYQSRFEVIAAETNPDAGEFVIGVLWADGFTAHSNESFMGSFLEGLGRKNALVPDNAGETQYMIDLEGFASINPSSIVIMCAPDDQAVLDEWQAEPLWQAFDAVKNGQVYVFNRNLWSKGRGLMAFDAILDDAVESGLLAETESNMLVCP